MNIGEAAQHSGLPAKTIRYYEDIGLVTPLRNFNGYRAFRDSDVHKLTFLGRARALGFTIEDCRTLMSLYEDQGRESAEVKRLASKHVAEIENKIASLQTMRDTLSNLISCCAGDDRPDCPILSDLAGDLQAAQHAD
ncbi:Cu(I)-responsive transcriptional regulator [Acidimangrovimonas pyrenivorans]|uniref:Cu(I)-responsive transcriptional regulator n=1 Tax=Acidimangrovimonas pyrenivorans TaxID=2030798 RepID=A0ABV7AH31_9RHOB